MKVKNKQSLLLHFKTENRFMSQEISKRYALRGVSASKEDVHNAIKNVDKGLFPQAFCKIVPDYLTNDDDYCLIMHADGQIQVITVVRMNLMLEKSYEAYRYNYFPDLL